jgi:hypothetical protein
MINLGNSKWIVGWDGRTKIMSGLDLEHKHTQEVMDKLKTMKFVTKKEVDGILSEMDKIDLTDCKFIEVFK